MWGSDKSSNNAKCLVDNYNIIPACTTHISRMVAERLLSVRTFTIYLASFSTFTTLATPVHPVRCWWNSFWSANKRLLYYSNQLFMPSDMWYLWRDGELFKIEKDMWQDKKFISSIPKITFFGVIELLYRRFFLSCSSNKVGTCDVLKISSLWGCL